MQVLKFVGFVYCVLTFCSAVVHAQDVIEIKEAWVREAPPAVTVLAAYMVIENTGATEIKLLSANSPQFDMVEIHKTVMEGGMAKMEAISELSIPAKGSVKLEPEGLHLMLMMSNQPLVAGDKVELNLEFSDGAAAIVSTVNAVVKKVP